MSQEIDPRMIEMLLQQYLQTAPDYTAKNVEKPYSLKYQKDATNYQQDVMSMLGDPLAAAMGGFGSFDPAAFEDVKTGQQEYEIPANPLQPYLKLSETSEEGAIARLVAAGMSPEEVVAKFAEKGYQNAPDDKQLDRVRTKADSLFTGNYDFQTKMASVPGMVQGEDGTWEYQGDGELLGNKVVVPEFGQSEAAKQYSDRGLPLPTDVFSEQDFGYNADDAQAALEAQTSKLAGLQAKQKSAMGTYQRSGMDDARTNLAAIGQRHNPDPILPAVQTSNIGGYGNYMGAAPMRQMEQPKPVSRDAVGLSALYDRALTHATSDRTKKAKISARRASSSAADELWRTSALKRATGYDRDYATKMSELHARAGLTPLAMVALRQYQSLRGG